MQLQDTITSADAQQPVETAAAAELGFWDLVAEDYEVNGRDWRRPGFRAVFMYRFGVWRMSVRPRLVRLPFSALYLFMHHRVRNSYGIELHYTARIGRRFRIAHQSGIVIHEYAEIGDDCTIRQNVTIGAAARYSADAAPRIGNNVDIGAGAVIVGKVQVGDNVKIGPNAVVMMDVPSDCTVVAPPGRVIQPPRQTQA